MPTISIIIPVYNVEKYLQACLNSVLKQSFSDFEVLCIDDCSTDGSLAVLQKFAQEDSRIKLFQNKTNLKAAGSRNVGLENAKGEYIYFIDADDYIDTDYLKELWETAQKSNADIVMNTSIILEKSSLSEHYIHPSMPKLPKDGCFINNTEAIDDSFCVVWMRLFKRAFLEQYSIRFQKVNMTEDNVFHYMTNFHASSIFAFCGQAAYHYVIRDDSVTGIVKANNQRDYVTMKANDIIFDYLESHNLLNENKAKLFKACAWIKVDTEEKYLLYKIYFKKIYAYLDSHKEMYSPLDLFFANSILDSSSLEDYIKRYSSNVSIAFLRARKSGRIGK